MSLTKVTFSMIEGDCANVLDYGAKGDGITDDTAAFTAAAAASNFIYVPDTADSFLLNGLNVDFGKKIFGAGKIKTSYGRVIDLSTVNLDFVDGPMKVMFTQSENSWEEMLDIKSAGYNTVMGYSSFSSNEVLVPNCEAVGMKNLVFSRLFTIIPSTIVPQTQFDDRPGVIGYYLLDEPVGNGVSLADQERVINAYRAVTNKPLFAAEYTVAFEALPTLLSPNFDVIFSDQYYNQAGAANPKKGNLLISFMLRNQFEFTFYSRQRKVIPLLGLLNTAVQFTQSEEDTIKLAQAQLPFSKDGSFGVFIWRDLSGEMTKDCTRTPAYRQAAQDLVSLSLNYIPYKIVNVPLGVNFSNTNNYYSIGFDPNDGVAPGTPPIPTVFPWEVLDKGSAINDHEQAFAQSGLAVTQNGGTIAFGDTPSGIMASYLNLDNQSGLSISILALYASITDDDRIPGIPTPSYTAPVGAPGINTVFGQLDTYGTASPKIEFVVTGGPITNPFANVYGYLIFSDIKEITFT